MLLAWLYEFTPEGFVRTEDLSVAQAKSARRITGRVLDFIIIGTLLLALVVLIVERHGFVETRPPASVAKSIAVLPFENASEDTRNGYFADGVQDEVLTDLSRIADLKVISRSSVEQYRNAQHRDLREIARQLSVAFVLEGRVQRDADRVRITAQLTDLSNHAQIWADRYDRQLADVFAIQTEIAEAIAQQLHAQISRETKDAIEQKPTTDLVAYDLYLHAAQLYRNISTSKNWEGDNRNAIALLERAIERDPQFSLAYCLVVDLNVNLYTWVDRSSAQLRRTKAALDNAIRLAPEAGETLMARGEFAEGVEQNFDAAVDMYNRAARLLPGDARLRRDLANAEEHRGRWDEALKNFGKARELDPRGPNTPNLLTELYLGLREHEKCDALCDEAIAAFPEGPNYFRAAKVQSAFARGDAKLARQRLAAIPQDWDPSGNLRLLPCRFLSPSATTRSSPGCSRLRAGRIFARS
jgi:TolB-like protein/Tfp pilus assembly protein PilF